MARIVCQVLHRADRITFLWSEGAASFEPYHLEGTERANLLDLAGQVHAQLHETDGAGLAQLGYRLYRAVFRQDTSDQGSAGAVQAWLAKLVSSGAIESLEFLSDAPGWIPWNVLLEEAGAPGFWGARFNLGAGRRVNALRQSPTQVKPTQRFAADLDSAQQLLAPQHALLDALRDAGALLHTITSLEDDLKEHVPDVLSLLVRFERGQLQLGADSFSIHDLQRWIEEPKEGNPDPLVILMASGAAAEQSAWQKLLGAASATFSGLVANETLLSPAQVFDVGHALGQRFIQGEQSLGEILRAVRSEPGAAALAFSAFCPPQVRVAAEGAADAPEAENQIETSPLPRLPYRPFAAFAATERALFFGRENDVLRGALVIDQAEAVGVLLHGSPAAGKTSYLQAGLLPYLEQESLGYQVLRDRSPLETPLAEKDYPILILRCTNDLAGQFADALSVFCAQPYVFTTPAGTQVNVDLPEILQKAVTGVAGTFNTAIQASAAAMTSEVSDTAAGDEDGQSEGVSARELWIALRDNNELLAKILDAITRSLPFELLIAVDQGEELLTQVHTPQQQERRQKAIDMLMRLSGGAARCKILYTIRSQALAELVSLFPGDRAPADWRVFYLRPLTEAEMVDALLWPTNREKIPYGEEIPHEKYGFALEDGMAPQIVADVIEASASEQQSPLAILQAVGALLYDRQVLEKKQQVLRVADVMDLGGVKAALGKYLDQTLERLPVTRQSRQALRALIGKLYTSHADGTLSRDVIPASKLQTNWDAAAEPVETIVNQAAQEQGLFEVQQLMIGGQQDVFVTLPQDSLAQLGKKIAGERAQQAYARTRVIDLLWIMVPLIFLAAAVTFWATRQYLSGNPDAIEEKLTERFTKAANEFVRQKITEFILTRRPELYYGQIARADQALLANNAQRAHDILMSEPAIRDPEDPLSKHLSDLRGFEWKHLWRRLNSERHLLEGHKGSVNSVVIADDGKRAASAGADGAVRIWNLQNGKMIASFTGAKTLHAAAFAPDGKTLAAAGDDKIVRVWDIGELKDDAGLFAKDPKKLEGHAEAVHAIAFGKDATELASAGADKSVIIWDLESGKAKFTLKDHAAAVKSLVYTSDGKTLVSAGDEGQLFLWDPRAGKKRDSKQTSYRTIAALAVSPDGKTLSSAGAETKFGADVGAIRFWELDGFKETHAPILGGPGFLAVAFGPDGKSIASGGKDHMVRLWELKTGKELHQWIGHVGSVNALSFAKDGSALVSASGDGNVKVWDPGQSSGIDVIMAHQGAVGALALNRDDKLLASGAHDGSVKLWDPMTNKLVKDLAVHKGAVTSLAFSGQAAGKGKDTFFLAAGTRDANNDGEIKIWQIQGDPKNGWTAKEHLTLKQHTKGVTCLAFHPSEDKADVLISGSADKSVKVWDAKTGKLLESHAGHKDEVRCVAFSFDGKTFASGGKDSLVCMYELGSKEIRTLTDMSVASIDSIALFEILIQNNDEDVNESFTGIVTGSADQTVRMWAYNHHSRQAALEKNLRSIGTFRAHTHDVSAVAYNKSRNSLIFSASWDGSIKIFDRAHERLTLTGHRGAVRAIAVAADQSFLASAGNDGTIRIWRTLGERAAAR